MAGANREPSSFVQSTSITGRSVCDAVLVEGAQHFQGAHHAEDAVEAATLGLGVDVRAGHHRRQAVVRPGTPAEDVAHLVDRDVEPASSSQDTRRSRACLSSGVSVSLCTPPPGVAPISAIGSRLLRRRSPFTRNPAGSMRFDPLSVSDSQPTRPAGGS